MSAYSTFRTSLAEHYIEFDQWRRLAEGAGLNPEDLSLSGASTTAIANILRMVHQQGKVELLQAFIADDNPHLLSQAEAYANEVKAAEGGLKKAGSESAFKRYFIAIFFGLSASLLGFAAFLYKETFGLFFLAAAIIVTGINLSSSYVAQRLLGQGRTDIMLTWAHRATLSVLVILSIGAGYLWYNGWQNNQQPNFIISFIEEDQPVVGQSVYLTKGVMAPNNESRYQETTNETGQVFFSLENESLYFGGILIEKSEQKRECFFPAFLVEEGQRNIDHDLKDLPCEAGFFDQSPSIPSFNALSVATTSPESINEAQLETVLQKVFDSNKFIGDSERRRRSPLGIPDAPIVVDHLFYTLGFDPAIRSPRWVQYLLETSKIQKVKRIDAWAFDPQIPRDMQTGPEAYVKNPYDRGQLVPRPDASIDSDFAKARESSDQVYYYSALVPQALKTSRLSWLRVEKLTRRLSEDLGAIYVIAGPIYPDLKENKAHLVIGPQNSYVPLALFRVLLRQTGDGSWRSVGFLVPNDGSVEPDAEKYLTSVELIEKQTGLRFFPDLPQAQNKIRLNTSIETFRE